MGITRKNAIALTLYNALLGALIIILNLAEKSGLELQTRHALAEAALASGWGGTTAGIMLWLIGIGIIVLTVYALAIPHTPKLSIPNEQFITFYTLFMLWLAMFLSVDLGLVVSDRLSLISLSPESFLIINLTLMTAFQGAILVLTYRYVRESGQKFLPWIARICFGTNAARKRTLVLSGIAAYFGFLPIVSTAAFVSELLLTGRELPIQPAVAASIAESPLFAIVIGVYAVTFAPFFEELIMRGIVFRGLLLQFDPTSAMFLSGAIFAAFHFNVGSFIPISALGILLAWLYYRTGSIVPSVVAHAIFNGVNALLLQFIR